MSHLSICFGCIWVGGQVLRSLTNLRFTYGCVTKSYHLDVFAKYLPTLIQDRTKYSERNLDDTLASHSISNSVCILLAYSWGAEMALHSALILRLFIFINRPRYVQKLCTKTLRRTLWVCEIRLLSLYSLLALLFSSGLICTVRRMIAVAPWVSGNLLCLPFSWIENSLILFNTR